MRPAAIKISLCLFLVLLISGCGLKKGPPLETLQAEDMLLEPESPKSDIKVSRQMVEEYAMIHQISDLKTAEYYLTHPDYAEEHPYRPTEEDRAFYERKLLEKMYPGFKELADRKGFDQARAEYMSVHPDSGGSTGVKSRYKVEETLEKSTLVGSEMKNAVSLYQEGRFDDAIEHMEVALLEDPTSPTMLYNLAVMHMKKGNDNEAVRYFQDCILQLRSTGHTNLNLIIHPGVYLGACVDLGMTYTRLGMYNEAIEVLKQAIHFRKDDLEANWNLAVAYWYMGEMDRLAEQMRKCIDLEPDNPSAHNIVGVAYFSRSLYLVALDEFRMAAKLDPTEKQYVYNEALTLARLDRYDEADKAFRKAEGFEQGEYLRQVYAELIPKNKAKKLYNEGCIAMENLNWSKAIDFFEAALEVKPDMEEVHVNLGVLYGKRGDTAKQIYHLEEAVRINDDLPNVHYNLGSAYFDARMYSKAMAQLSRAVELDPSYRDANFKLGLVFFKAGRYDEAAATFEKCLALSSDWFEAHLNLGTCYLKTGDVKDAISHFERSVELRPGSAEAHYYLGEAYMRTEEFDKTSAHFQKALEIDPTYMKARERLAELEKYRKETAAKSTPRPIY